MKRTTLTLRRETLRVLSGIELRAAAGGDPPAQTEFCSEWDTCTRSGALRGSGCQSGAWTCVPCPDL